MSVPPRRRSEAGALRQRPSPPAPRMRRSVAPPPTRAHSLPCVLLQLVPPPRCRLPRCSPDSCPAAPRHLSYAAHASGGRLFASVRARWHVASTSGSTLYSRPRRWTWHRVRTVTTSGAARAGGRARAARKCRAATRTGPDAHGSAIAEGGAVSGGQSRSSRAALWAARR